MGAIIPAGSMNKALTNLKFMRTVITKGLNGEDITQYVSQLDRSGKIKKDYTNVISMACLFFVYMFGGFTIVTTKTYAGCGFNAGNVVQFCETALVEGEEYRRFMTADDSKIREDQKSVLKAFFKAYTRGLAMIFGQLTNMH